MRVPLLRGNQLDYMAEKLGLIRKTYFWFIKESDKKLRKRLQTRVIQLCDSNIVLLNNCDIERF